MGGRDRPDDRREHRLCRSHQRLVDDHRCRLPSALGLEGDRIAQGRLVSLFLFGYGLSAWFITPLFEFRWSVRTSLLISVLLWTIFTGASAVASGMAAFLVCRLLLGGAEGPLFSLKTMYVREHFAPNEVGKPNAVSSLGVSIGLGLGYSIVSFLFAHFGSRELFWALAALNLVIGLPLIALFIRSLPPRVPPAAKKARRFRCFCQHSERRIYSGSSSSKSAR